MIMINKSHRRRKRGRLKRKWMDCIERDLRSLGMINWRSVTLRKDEWRKFLRHARTHEKFEYHKFFFLLLLLNISNINKRAHLKKNYLQTNIQLTF